ncbi:hypothetical protein AF335_09325 [Streptomyces eurocidicus]|uniref:Spore coat protein U domain-containing protein n=1 Tax=Streptomyces eurocidicus TaxID=66423 RepID=A0A2N8P120_STREU|nr:hypothetical protein [Streptomyces eurocidicus]MBB5121849.1 hypothetical protein [Streptomyces eurocidicus]MBF6055107.1 hypothetical protein [Streptomyces eurocidicus]PNE34704.1 hypothetical protein AF335_09325 [Streptomyces eurocidicus]
MLPVSARNGATAMAAALLLTATAAAPHAAAGTARVRLATLNCAGSINVNVHPLNGAVDGRSGTNFRCATPDRSFAAELTLSGTVTGSGDLFYTTRTNDSLKLTDTGQVFRFPMDRRFERDTTAASGNATERGSSSQGRDSGSGTFGTGTGLVTFLITNNYTLDVNV